MWTCQVDTQSIENKCLRDRKFELLLLDSLLLIVSNTKHFSSVENVTVDATTGDLTVVKMFKVQKFFNLTI